MKYVENAANSNTDVLPRQQLSAVENDDTEAPPPKNSEGRMMALYRYIH